MPPSPDRPIVVAIDGPAASGKSSTAQWVAKELGFRHVDSGALYRAAAAVALRSCGPVEGWRAEEIVQAARRIRLEPQDTSFVPLLDGEDLSDEIRGSAVTGVVPRVAQMDLVRRWVNEQVRDVGRRYDVVVDGRDMGTAVFPAAQVKIFLVADPSERARRRLIQRLSRRPSDDEIAAEVGLLVSRDQADALQTVAADDSVRIDTTTLTQADQVEQIVGLVRARTGSGTQFAGE
ncbi:MAG: (d)CMP kinase [Gemmatimonadetes bacterium]|nr:(d)CMP kinase [Gemmatimonadota bacterium]